MTDLVLVDLLLNHSRWYLDQKDSFDVQYGEVLSSGQYVVAWRHYVTEKAKLEGVMGNETYER